MIEDDFFFILIYSVYSYKDTLKRLYVCNPLFFGHAWIISTRFTLMTTVNMYNYNCRNVKFLAISYSTVIMLHT